MQTKHICVFINIWTKVRLAHLETDLNPPVKYFTDCSKAVLLLWIIYFISVLFLLSFPARLFIDALWSPAGKGLTSWLSFVMSNCEVVTFHWYPGSDWWLIVSIPDLCSLSYFHKKKWRLFTITTFVLHLVTLKRKYDITCIKVSKFIQKYSTISQIWPMST